MHVLQCELPRRGLSCLLCKVTDAKRLPSHPIDQRLPSLLDSWRESMLAWKFLVLVLRFDPTIMNKFLFSCYPSAINTGMVHRPFAWRAHVLESCSQ